MADSDKGAELDERLLERWRDGDPRAGDLLLRRHFRDVWGFFRRRVPDAADELAQQTFEACVAARDRFAGRSSVRTFLFAIAHRRLIDNENAKRRRDVVELEDPAGDLPSATQAQIQRERAKIIVRAMQLLPRDEQIVLDLCYWQEMNSTQIAEVVGATASTVRGRLRNARARLVAHLETMDLHEAVRASTITHLKALDLVGPEESGG